MRAYVYVCVVIYALSSFIINKLRKRKININTGIQKF